MTRLNVETTNYYSYYSNLTNPRFGIYGSYGAKFQLTKYQIESKIENSTLKSMYTQVYTNNNASPTEAFYELPLPFTSTICDLEVEYRGEIFKGKVKENKKAEEKYSDSIASGGQSFMIQRSDTGVFKLSLGNIEPNTPVTIRFEVIGQVNSHQESIHYFIHHASLPVEYKYDLSVSVDVHLTSGVGSVESIHISEFPIQIEKDQEKDDHVTIKFHNPEFQASSAKRDILFIITPKESTQIQSTIEYSESESSYAVGLTYFPDFKNIDELDINQKSEYIFVVDCSGSMSGASMGSAKTALDILMRSLPIQSKFNIYRFGSGFNKLFPSSKIYDNSSLSEATVMISKTSADLGGTNLLPPIKDIFETPYDPEYPRQVFILTDGGVSNRAELISYVRKESHVRMFTFGIGSGVDKELVTGLSIASRGEYEMIDDLKTMDAKVIKLLRKSMEPMLSNIKLEWPSNLSVTQAPQLIRPVFNQERMMLYALIDKKKSSGDINSSFELKITADSPKGDKLTFKVPLSLEKPSSKSLDIHKLTALMIINDLTDLEKKKQQNHAERIIDLSKRFNVLSTHTSFIITKEATLNAVTENSMETVKINDIESVKNIMDQSISQSLQRGERLLCSESLPTELLSTKLFSTSELLPAEFKFKQNSSTLPKLSMFSGFVTGVKNILSPSPQSSLSQPVEQEKKRKMSSSKDKSLHSNSYSSAINKREKEEEINSGSNVSDLLLDIIKSQNANGSWSKGGVITIKKNSPKELSSNEEIWVTLVTLARLMSEFSSSKDKWMLIAKKAKMYIMSELTKLSLSSEYDKFFNEAQSSI